MRIRMSILAGLAGAGLSCAAPSKQEYIFGKPVRRYPPTVVGVSPLLQRVWRDQGGSDKRAGGTRGPTKWVDAEAVPGGRAHSARTGGETPGPTSWVPRGRVRANGFTEYVLDR